MPDNTSLDKAVNLRQMKMAHDDLSAKLSEKATVADVMATTVTSANNTYTVQQLLEAIASLMTKTVVVDG